MLSLQSLQPCCPCSSSGPVKQQDGGDGNVITPPQPINIDWVVRFYPPAVKPGVRARRRVSHIWALITRTAGESAGKGGGGILSSVTWRWYLTGVQRALWSVCPSGQHVVIPKCDRLASSGSGIKCVWAKSLSVRIDWGFMTGHREAWRSLEVGPQK